MVIGIINASSQKDKNDLIYESVKEYAKNDSVINFGCDKSENDCFSYLDIALVSGLLINSGVVDFIVTGCSSGQGMNLALNSIPNVICGYVPTPKDAFLFAQINNGNAISLPLGEDYTYFGSENLRETIKSLFSEPFGQGYPKSEAERKISDTKKLKELRKLSQKGFMEFLSSLDSDTVSKALKKNDAVKYIFEHTADNEMLGWLKHNITTSL